MTIEKQLETLLLVLYLNRTCSFDFWCISLGNIWNEAYAVSMPEEYVKKNGILLEVNSALHMLWLWFAENFPNKYSWE